MTFHFPFLVNLLSFPSISIVFIITIILFLPSSPFRQPSFPSIFIFNMISFPSSPSSTSLPLCHLHFIVISSFNHHHHRSGRAVLRVGRGRVRARLALHGARPAGRRRRRADERVGRVHADHDARPRVDGHAHGVPAVDAHPVQPRPLVGIGPLYYHYYWAPRGIGGAPID